jgi:small subunit ribosomal protein S13
MVYILETKLSDNKSIHFALRSIYGLGENNSLRICKSLGFSTNLKVRDLSADHIKMILKFIDRSELLTSNVLRKTKNLKLKTLIFIKSYRGLRKIKGLPVRGQRTHTNARTTRKIRG